MSAYLTGEAVVLRPICDEDLPVLAEWDQDPEIVRLMGRKFAPDASARDWFRRTANDRRSKALAITTAAGRLIGTVELEQINWLTGHAELRICIGCKELWGQGLGTQALDAMLDLAFRSWSLRLVYLRVYAFNLRAIALYERCGFTKKGIMPPSRRRHDPDAVVLMALSRERFRRQHQAAAAGAV